MLARLRSRIGPNETWRLTVERRTDTTLLDRNQIIRSLTEVLDTRVDLSHPDKVLLVQLFDDWIAFSAVSPSETFSVVKVRAARPPQVLAPNPADETLGG